jgi:hypothetical protein
MLHGIGSRKVIRYNSNPAQLSRFNANAFRQVSFSTSVVPAYNPLAACIVENESYEAFTRMRQATRQVDSVERPMVAKDMSEI